MPAEAGIQKHPVKPISRFWIPAFAGMTRVEWRNFPTLFLDRLWK